MSDARSPFIPWLATDEEGFVTSTTRRWIYFVDRYGDEHQGTASTRALDITVGDRIRFERERDEYLIKGYDDRTNCLKRLYGKKVKLLCSNIDVLFVVTAVGQLFQPSFVDRVLCVAELEQIPACIVVNKTDLQMYQDTAFLIDVYEELGIEVLQTNTVDAEGLDPFLERLHREPLRVVSLVGVSGVGKSSILNRLIPGAQRSTREVSEKSGQGRQTTSQAEAFHYSDDEANLFVIDLPGVQNFGISDLSLRELQSGMPDLFELAQHCEYGDCQHIAEPNCAVKLAFERGVFPACRFQSYIAMKEEIERAKEY
ncbi:MAG: ribosome small subunit-dependent GTPase A [Bdellovibrionales bacterium]|nr:ribosome small subunit-dependent GTPase A [Bdellovibrionales bacterium]